MGETEDIMYIPSQIRDPYMGQHAERVAASWGRVMTWGLLRLLLLDNCV